MECVGTASCPYHHHHRADKQEGAPFDRVRPSCSATSQLPDERLSRILRDTSLSLRAHPGFVHTFLKGWGDLTYILGMQTSFPDRAEIGTGVKEFRATLLRSDNKQAKIKARSLLSAVLKWPLSFVMSLRAEFGCIYVSCRVEATGFEHERMFFLTAPVLLKCWKKKPLWMRRMQSGFLLRCKTHRLLIFIEGKREKIKVCIN